MIERFRLEGSEHPNFIGCWVLKNLDLCDELVEVFESNQNMQKPGVTAERKIQEEIKKSTDITIAPNELEKEKFHSVSKYVQHLKICYLDYIEQWDFLKSSMPVMHIGPFNLQRYQKGDHFGALHAERTRLSRAHRTFAWMTYLNDVLEGGETIFPMFGVSVKPVRGKTLLWPSEWTHAHLGKAVEKGNKYIITGWMHFPDEKYL